MSNGRKPDDSGVRSSGKTTGVTRTPPRSGTRSQTGWSSSVARTPEPPTPLARWRRRFRDRWRSLLAIEQLWILVFLAVGSWALVPRTGFFAPDIEVGTIAGRDYVAPRDELLLAEDATAARRARARAEILPVYDFDAGEAVRLEEALGDLFASGRALVNGGAQESWEELLQATTLEVTPPQLAYLRRKEFAPELEAQLRGVFGELLSRGVVAAKESLLAHRGSGIRLRQVQTGTESIQLDLFDYLDYPDEARDSVIAQLRSWSGLRGNERAELVELVVSNVTPNLYLNQAETLARQEAAAAAVEPVYTRLRKGQIIVRKGDSVDDAAARVIRALSNKETRGLAMVLPILGVFLGLGLAILGLWVGLRREPRGAHRSPTMFSELLLLLLVSILGGRAGVLVSQALAASFERAPFDMPTSYLLAIPFAAPALLAMLLYGRWVALLTGIAFSTIAGLMAGIDQAWQLGVYALAGSLAVAFWVDDLQFRQRSFTLRAGLVVSVVGCGALLVLRSLGGGFEGGLPQLAFEILCALLGGVFVAAVASFMVPLLESTFSLTTAIRLVELGNTNLPLLRRLAFEAPGSFQHSLMVANLAKAGSEAIGADPVLAYTGALYHDIGKVLRPDYFVENQRPGQNRHDKLQPSMSALILISHVKDGVELAREAHLPQPLIDAIEQHHGNRLISFFYHRAIEQQEPGAGDVSEEKFRYPGPRPSSKVMGVLMLADGVEAASRSLNDPSPARLRAVIRAITEDCLKDGQLDETDLTLGDLKRVGDAFQRVLAHIYHRRLDYPGFDFGEKKERRMAETAGEPAAALAATAPISAAPAAQAAGAGDETGGVEIDESSLAGQA